jgi:ATP-dependent DNA helicase RecG
MIIDDRMLRLALFDAVEETQRYLISQMKVAFEITGETTQRTEILEYPKPAIRELILNCLIHRDYLSPIDVQIKIFDNYITFYNPGKLYGDLTIEDLKTNTYHASARNKLIAEAFYLTGDIEKYGSGFRRIREEISKYPTMELEYAEIPNGFQTILKYSEQKISTEKLNKNQILIIEAIRLNPNLTSSELSEKIGIRADKVRVNIQKLKSLGLLERIGADKGGYWKLNT